MRDLRDMDHRHYMHDPQIDSAKRRRMEAQYDQGEKAHSERAERHLLQ